MDAAALGKHWKVPLAVVLGVLTWFGLRWLTSGQLERTALRGYLDLAALLVLIVAASRRWRSRGAG
jgi:hypothetical protein